MIKDIAWLMFKNTGNIDTFLEFKQIRDIENNHNLANIDTSNNNSIHNMQKVELDGNYKNEWNNNF